MTLNPMPLTCPLRPQAGHCPALTMAAHSQETTTSKDTMLQRLLRFQWGQWHRVGGMHPC